VKKSAYNAASLERVLRAFEERYGFSSAAFYRAHLENGDLVAEMTGSHRQAWAGFYVEWQSFDDSAFAERTERELQLA
jgi:hypothetical protein